MDADALELPVRRGAEVIFYVARAADILRIGRAAGEFAEDDAIGLAQDVGENVEAAAMGHAEDDFLHAVLAAIFDDTFERRNHRFAAVEAAALGPDIIFRQELLRSEEHTSELQSLMRISYAVFCLKKKTQNNH